MPTANTSRQLGYLTPVNTIAAYDLDLDKIFQAHVVGITGMTGSLVRPRWQPTPPVQPPLTTDWCAIGVSRIVNMYGPAIVHQGTDATDPDNGTDTREWHEEIEVLASFYGPGASAKLAAFVEGCGIPQNNDQLKQYNMAFVSASDPIAAPDFQNQQWIRKFDVTLTFRRRTQRVYQVRNLADAPFNYSRD